MISQRVYALQAVLQNAHLSACGMLGRIVDTLTFSRMDSTLPAGEDASVRLDASICDVCNGIFKVCFFTMYPTCQYSLKKINREESCALSQSSLVHSVERSYYIFTEVQDMACSAAVYCDLGHKRGLMME